MKSKRFLWYCSFPLFLLCGCAEPKVLEKIGLITAVGYDLVEKNSIYGTVAEVKIDPNAPKDIVTLEAQSLTVRGLRANLNKKASKQLESGQLRVVLFGEDLLKHERAGIAEALSSDPSISDMTYITMVEGQARDLINLKSDKIPDIGTHLFRPPATRCAR